ncbi:hypothetical protein QTP88_022968 [Uroleucon formosanum]
MTIDNSGINVSECSRRIGFILVYVFCKLISLKIGVKIVYTYYSTGQYHILRLPTNIKYEIKMRVFFLWIHINVEYVVTFKMYRF